MFCAPIFYVRTLYATVRVYVTRCCTLRTVIVHGARVLYTTTRVSHGRNKKKSILFSYYTTALKPPATASALSFYSLSLSLPLPPLSLSRHRAPQFFSLRPSSQSNFQCFKLNAHAFCTHRDTRKHLVSVLFFFAVHNVL